MKRSFHSEEYRSRKKIKQEVFPFSIKKADFLQAQNELLQVTRILSILEKEPILVQKIIHLALLPFSYIFHPKFQIWEGKENKKKHVHHIVTEKGIEWDG